MNQLVQELANGLAAGSYIAVLAMGYALIFGTTREFHFAHGSVFMVAGWMLFVGTVTFEWGWLPSVMLAAGVAAGLGLVIERGFYAPLRGRANRDVGIILTGLGLFFVIENTVAIIEGSRIRFPRNPFPGVTQLGDVFFTNMQIIGIALVPLVWLSVILLLKRSRLGRSIRAVGSDPALSYTVGVDARSVRLWVFGIGSALASVAAFIVTFDEGFAPPMGLQAILWATVAVIVGGIGSVTGAAIAGILLGMSQHVGFLGIGSEWQNPIAFGILMVAILLKPTGIGSRT